MPASREAPVPVGAMEGGAGTPRAAPWRWARGLLCWDEILGRDDLPPSVALEPGVSPDEGLDVILAVLGGRYLAFAAVGDGEVVIFTSPSLQSRAEGFSAVVGFE